MDVVFRILNNENEIFEALGEEWDLELGEKLLTDISMEKRSSGYGY